MRPALRDRLVLPILLPIGIVLVIAGILYGFSRILLSITPTAAWITAIIVAGRSGASLGAELGSMRLTEQVDAL